MATMTVVKKNWIYRHNGTKVQYQTFILENEIKYVHELQKFSIITFFLLFSLFLPLSLSTNESTHFLATTDLFYRWSKI